MTPFRVLIHLKVMCTTPLETSVTIKSMATAYKNATNADKEYDVEWYAKQVIKLIDDLAVTVPPHTSDEIKAQLEGRLTGLVPGY